jgi:hypothetical protein
MMGARMAEPATLTDRRVDLTSLAPAGDPVGSSLLRMFRFERRWLVRVFEVLLPRGADPRIPLGAADVPMGRFVDDLLADSSLEFVAGLRLCLWMMMLAPLVVLRRLRTFLGIDPAQQAAVLERLRTSDVYVFREVPMLLKTIACLGFFGLPQVQGAIGLNPIDTTPPSWAVKGEGER